MAANVELWMPFDNVYQHALSIPVDTCRRFSVFPLKWLRYVGFTIFGSEGHISSSPGGQVIEYYQDTIQPGNYYYLSQEALMLDPDLMNDRTSYSSNDSTSRGNFLLRVTQRDGTCIMTGSTIVEACHIIPHAKGDQYMINFVTHKHEYFHPALDSINDTRNGILLARQLHVPFGGAQVAFLQTPNFAMTVNDVDLVMQPTADIVGFITQPADAARRLTVQHFDNSDPLTTMIAPHNSDARQSDSDEWPPPLIFDVAYGCASLKTWGVHAFMELARGHTRDIYYNQVDNGDDQNGGGRDERRSQQKIDRDARAKRRAERNIGPQASNTVEIADMVLALWMQNAGKARCQAHAMKTDRTREKVQMWLDSTERTD